MLWWGDSSSAFYHKRSTKRLIRILKDDGAPRSLWLLGFHSRARHSAAQPLRGSPRRACESAAFQYKSVSFSTKSIIVSMKSIILSTKCIIFSSKSILCNMKSTVFCTKSIVFHMKSIMFRYENCSVCVLPVEAQLRSTARGITLHVEVLLLWPGQKCRGSLRCRFLG